MVRVQPVEIPVRSPFGQQLAARVDVCSVDPLRPADFHHHLRPGGAESILRLLSLQASRDLNGYLNIRLRKEREEITRLDISKRKRLEFKLVK